MLSYCQIQVTKLRRKGENTNKMLKLNCNNRHIFKLKTRITATLLYSGLRANLLGACNDYLSKYIDIN
jgi:hypothetical protein